MDFTSSYELAAIDMAEKATDDFVRGDLATADFRMRIAQVYATLAAGGFVPS
jgi:hypothetical protein